MGILRQAESGCASPLLIPMPADQRSCRALVFSIDARRGLFSFTFWISILDPALNIVLPKAFLCFMNIMLTAQKSYIIDRMIASPCIRRNMINLEIPA
jgi:hypothetical protein